MKHLTISKINKKQLLFLNTDSLYVKKKFKYKFTTSRNKFLGICVSIKFVSNNIFCTFWSLSNKRTFRVRSAGIKKLKTSKRRLFFYGKIFLESFFRELMLWKRKYKEKSSLFLNLNGPKKFRKLILKNILEKVSAINFVYNKSFNGCKESKKRRKKRLGFRSFSPFKF